MEDDHRPFARAAQLLEDIARGPPRETVCLSDDTSRRKVQSVRADSSAWPISCATTLQGTPFSCAHDEEVRSSGAPRPRRRGVQPYDGPLVGRSDDVIARAHREKTGVT